MAARKNKVHQDPATIERMRGAIKSSQLINTLMAHANGKRDMKNSQVTAALGLLKKTIPDLTAADNKTEITHHYVAEVPAPVQDVNEWQRRYADPLKPPTVQ